MRTSTSLAPPRPRAFTLIEVMVTIAIIGLLVSTLLPALGSARHAARAVACLSNQKQLVTAWTMYAHEHRDRVMPLAYTDESDVGSGDGIFWWGSDGTGSGTIDHASGLLAPYLAGWLGARSVFECPSQGLGTYIPQGSAAIPEERRVTSTYGYNGYYLSPSKTPGWSGSIGSQPWKRLSDLARPTDLLVFADTLLVTNPVRLGRSSALLDPPMLFQGDGAWEPNPSPTTAFRHGVREGSAGASGSTVAATADGSARSLGAEPEWIVHPSHRVGSVGISNGPFYVPDWQRWR
jgi:prepilin-type N-terminal cleavage/methylation domain-containing protein